MYKGMDRQLESSKCQGKERLNDGEDRMWDIMSRSPILIVVQILMRSYLVYILHQAVSDFHIWHRRHKAGDRLG